MAASSEKTLFKKSPRWNTYTQKKEREDAWVALKECLVHFLALGVKPYVLKEVLGLGWKEYRRLVGGAAYELSRDGPQFTVEELNDQLAEFLTSFSDYLWELHPEMSFNVSMVLTTHTWYGWELSQRLEFDPQETWGKHDDVYELWKRVASFLARRNERLHDLPDYVFEHNPNLLTKLCHRFRNVKKAGMMSSDDDMHAANHFSVSDDSLECEKLMAFLEASAEYDYPDFFFRVHVELVETSDDDHPVSNRNGLVRHLWLPE